MKKVAERRMIIHGILIQKGMIIFSIKMNDFTNKKEKISFQEI
jgi:hypothetical protein